MQEADRWPDRLSGEGEPVRVFDSAEGAMMFLARQSATAAPAVGRGAGINIPLAKYSAKPADRSDLTPDESRRA